MCVLNVRGDYAGLTHHVWHTNCYPIIMPVCSVAGKGERMHLVRVEWQPMGNTWGKEEQLGQRMEERARIHLMSVRISFLILTYLM